MVENRRSLITKSFIEKSEFVNALINARKEGKAPPGGGGASLKTNNCDEDATADCCAECGKAGGGDVSLKMCKSCMQIKYCSATCQKNHWAKRSTKNHVNNEPSIYAMKRCSRTSRLRRTVPSAFYLRRRICCPVPRFHLRLYSYPPWAWE